MLTTWPRHRWPFPVVRRAFRGSAPDVDVEGDAAGGIGFVEEAAQRHHCGVVDQNVDTAEFVDHLADKAVPRFSYGDVEGVSARSSTMVAAASAAVPESRSPMQTIAPWEANSSAVARPMPRPPQETTTTAPSSMFGYVVPNRLIPSTPRSVPQQVRWRVIGPYGCRRSDRSREAVAAWRPTTTAS
ncbi:hypothetical protein ABH922_003907 [Rhodococcus sp. 27YEA15]